MDGRMKSSSRRRRLAQSHAPVLGDLDIDATPFQRFKKRHPIALVDWQPLLGPDHRATGHARDRGEAALAQSGKGSGGGKDIGGNGRHGDTLKTFHIMCNFFLLGSSGSDIRMPHGRLGFWGGGKTQPGRKHAFSFNHSQTGTHRRRARGQDECIRDQHGW